MASRSLVPPQPPSRGRARDDRPCPGGAEAEAGEGHGRADVRPKRVPILLRVQIAIARDQGERKVASVAHTGRLTTNDRKRSAGDGRGGTHTVISYAKSDDGKSTWSRRRVQERGEHHRPLGGGPLGDELLRGRGQRRELVDPQLTDARMMVGRPRRADSPMFRTFNVSLNPTLRDGQSIEAVASTHRCTGARS